MKNTPKIISKDGIELKLEWAGNQIASVSRVLGKLPTQLKRFVGVNPDEATIVYHHFLLYHPDAAEPWQLASHRYQPAGVPEDVDLPRKHYFHVHRAEGAEKLKQLVITENTLEVVLDDENVFQNIIDEIEKAERQTMVMLGGVGLVLGFFTGPAAVIAGLAGVIAPRLTSGLTKVGLNALGNKWQRVKKARAERSARKAQEKQLACHEVVINPVLALVWDALENQRHYEASENMAEALTSLPESQQAPTRTALWSQYGQNSRLDCESAPWLYFCRPDEVEPSL